MSNQDDNQWYFCTNENSEHLPPNLKYAQYIPPHSKILIAQPNPHLNSLFFF